MAAPRFALLSTLDHPLLPGFLAELRRHGISNYAVICDSRGIGAKSASLLIKRMNGWNPAVHYEIDILKDLPNIPFYFVESHNSEKCSRLINLLDLGFLINAGTTGRLAGNILAASTKGVINVHPGELPHYRGKNCPEWAIHYNDPVLVSAHLMTEEYDEGLVFETQILETDGILSYSDFRKEIYLLTFRLAARTAHRFLAGECSPLFDSRTIASRHGIHEAMTEELLDKVIASFSAARN
jgi:folate-dependent phosphoribosylglycinamide formyltransferase PurN